MSAEALSAAPSNVDGAVLCACNCGRPAPIAKRNSTRGGWIKGQPMRFIAGHVKFVRGTANPSYRHGLHALPEYHVFQTAKARCVNRQNKNWDNYGGRGICFTFESFEQLYQEVGPRPTPAHTLERMENERGYEPGNVCWATRKEQAANTRVRKIENFSDADILKEAQRRGLIRA